MPRDIPQETLEEYWVKLNDARSNPSLQKEIIKEIWEEAYNDGYEDGEPYYMAEHE